MSGYNVVEQEDLMRLESERSRVPWTSEVSRREETRNKSALPELDIFMRIKLSCLSGRRTSESRIFIIIILH